MASNVRAYIEQLVKVAGKGNLVVEWALHTGRMKLVCPKCDVTMTTFEPDRADKIDYSIQNFLQIHGHNGGHNDTQMVNVGLGKVIPMTCDFKNVPFKAVPKEIYEAAKAATMIDDNWANVNKINGQMSAYDKEIAQAMSPEQLAKKIALLQQTDYSEELKKGISELKAKGLMSPEQVGVQQEQIAGTKAELQALQNILTLKNLAKKKSQLMGELSGQHATPAPPPVKKEKPLKIATGRKFR